MYTDIISATLIRSSNEAFPRPCRPWSLADPAMPFLEAVGVDIVTCVLLQL